MKRNNQRTIKSNSKTKSLSNELLKKMARLKAAKAKFSQ